MSDFTYVATLPELADAVRTPKRNHVATSSVKINPGRPDLARAAEFAPGWLVDVNIANSDNMRIIRAAADVFGIIMLDDLAIAMPNG